MDDAVVAVGLALVAGFIIGWEVKRGGKDKKPCLKTRPAECAVRGCNTTFQVSDSDAPIVFRTEALLFLKTGIAICSQCLREYINYIDVEKLPLKDPLPEIWREQPEEKPFIISAPAIVEKRQEEDMEVW